MIGLVFLTNISVFAFYYFAVKKDKMAFKICVSMLILTFVLQIFDVGLGKIYFKTDEFISAIERVTSNF